MSRILILGSTSDYFTDVAQHFAKKVKDTWTVVSSYKATVKKWETVTGNWEVLTRQDLSETNTENTKHWIIDNITGKGFYTDNMWIKWKDWSSLIWSSLRPLDGIEKEDWSLFDKVVMVRSTNNDKNNQYFGVLDIKDRSIIAFHNLVKSLKEGQYVEIVKGKVSNILHTDLSKVEEKKEVVDKPKEIKIKTNTTKEFEPPKKSKTRYRLKLEGVTNLKEVKHQIVKNFEMPLLSRIVTHSQISTQSDSPTIVDIEVLKHREDFALICVCNMLRAFKDGGLLLKWWIGDV